MKIDQITENSSMNPDDIYNSVRATLAKIKADHAARPKQPWPEHGGPAASKDPEGDEMRRQYHRDQNERERTSVHRRNGYSGLEEAPTKEGVGGGTLGAGLNQWNTNNPVSYEHVLDEVTDKVLAEWADWVTEQELNELSVDKMQAYKKQIASPETFKTRPFRKLAKGAEGNATATRKINAKMGNRAANPGTARATYEERLAEFVDLEEDDFNDVLNKQHAEKPAPQKKPVKDIPYHNWIIRYRPASVEGEKVQWMVIDKKGEAKGKGEAMSDKEAVSAAEDYIKQGGGTKQQATDKVTVDFNVDFTREFGDEFFANIVADGNGPALIAAYEAMPGLKKSYARNQKSKMTATTTKLTCIPMSAAEANNAGLQPNGRYILGPKDDQGDGSAKFPLIYQSTVQGKGDLMRMGKPGLTVAHNREATAESIEDMEEAYEGPWKGDPAKNAKAPKSSMQGSGNVRLSDLIKDTIETHGVKWAFDYYVKKHGMPPRHFGILSGLMGGNRAPAAAPAPKPQAQVIDFPKKATDPMKKAAE